MNIRLELNNEDDFMFSNLKTTIENVAKKIISEKLEKEIEEKIKECVKSLESEYAINRLIDTIVTDSNKNTTILMDAINERIIALPDDDIKTIILKAILNTRG